jgi:protein tyrosine/serine phosphatase
VFILSSTADRIAATLSLAFVLTFAITVTATAAPGTDSAEPGTTKETSAPATQAHPDTTFDKERFTREVLNNKDLPNLHEVHPYLLRSGEPTEEGLRQLKQRGVKTIIDLRGGDKRVQEKEWAKSLGLEYINLPMSSEPPTKAQVQTFMKKVRQARANPENGSVLVHCAHGSDRTGCLVGIWRVTEDGWTYGDAYKEMRHYWFTPKFTKLSGAVKQYAESKNSAAEKKTASPAAVPAVN